MAANIIVDIIISIIIVIGAVLGIKRGFIVTVAKPVKFVLAIVLSFALCDVVAGFIFEPMIKEPITSQLTSYLNEKYSSIAPDSGESLPTLLKLAAVMTKVDISMFSKENSEQFIGDVVNKLSSPVIHILAMVISFIVLYFVLRLLLALALKLIDAIFDRGVFGVLNRVLGFIFSTIMALCITWLLVVIIGFIFNLSAFDNVKWMSEFSGGYIYRFFKRYSPLDLLLSF